MSEPPATRTRLPPPPPPLPAAALGKGPWYEQRSSPRSPGMVVPAGAVVPGSLLSAGDLDRSRLRGNSLGDLLKQDSSSSAGSPRPSVEALTPKSPRTPKTPAGAVTLPASVSASAPASAAATTVVRRSVSSPRRGSSGGFDLMAVAEGSNGASASASAISSASAAPPPPPYTTSASIASTASTASTASASTSKRLSTGSSSSDAPSAPRLTSEKRTMSFGGGGTSVIHLSGAQLRAVLIARGHGVPKAEVLQTALAELCRFHGVLSVTDDELSALTAPPAPAPAPVPAPAPAPVPAPAPAP
eukprot:scaffold27168_cov59-Phaeocystis_antarctica.AAC.3